MRRGAQQLQRCWRSGTEKGSGVVLALAGALLWSAGCGPRRDSTPSPDAPGGAERYIKRAIRSSNEGVILLPSHKANRVYELGRLQQIAQELRDPAARCFLARAVVTIAIAPESERGFEGVPEGQVKIRARISPFGEVVRTEVLENGFSDEAMPECVAKAIEAKKFPENQSGVIHFVDVVYWVSLGLQSDVHTEAYSTLVRRETTAAAVRAKPCLAGRTPPGRYHVTTLNLVDHSGNTMINRIDADVPETVRSCVARAFRDLRLPSEPGAFVRPVAGYREVTVEPDGGIVVQDEQWLSLIELEEQTQLAQQQALREAEAEEVQQERRQSARDELRRGLRGGADSGGGPTDAEAAAQESIEPADEAGEQVTDETEPLPRVEDPVVNGQQHQQRSRTTPPGSNDDAHSGQGGIPLELGPRR